MKKILIFIFLFSKIIICPPLPEGKVDQAPTFTSKPIENPATIKIMNNEAVKQATLEKNNTQEIATKNSPTNKSSFLKLPTFTFTASSKNNPELTISPRQDINTTIAQAIDIRINEWILEYLGTSMTSSMYIQADLQDTIENSIFTKDPITKSRQLIDANIDLAKIESSLKTYAKKYAHPDVTTVINETLQTIERYKKENTKTSQKTSNIVANFYPPQVKAALLEMLHITPQIDPSTGMITNMPSLEMIKEEAVKNPTKKSFQALQDTVLAIQIAEYAIKNDPSFLDSNSSSIMKELGFLKTECHQLLTNPLFDKYQSFLLKDILDQTGLGEMTVASAVNHFRTGMQVANDAAATITEFTSNELLNSSGYALSAAGGYARMGITGAIIDTLLYHYGKEQIPAAIKSFNSMKLSDLIEKLNPSEKANILDAQATMKNLQDPNYISLSTEINKLLQGSNKEQIQKAQEEANRLIENFYYQPQQIQTIMNFMNIKPEFDQKTGAILNMPSIENIITTAKKYPSEQAYKALKSALKATDVALYSANLSETPALGYSLKTKQLFLYKNDLKTLLESPTMIRYKNSAMRALNFAQSLTPKTIDFIKASGALDTTVNQLLNEKTNTSNLFNYTLKNTSLGSTTLEQMVS
ncbi:MAG: hypothetical protein ACXWL2_03335 [Candidatus Chromulinivorax sp.]